MQPSCDRLRIGLRPCATCHKFRLFTGFAAGRPPEQPPGRPLRYRIQAMEMSADRKKKYTASGLVRRGRPESLFGPSGDDQRKAQDGCQNGQLWLGRPLRYSATAYPGIIGKSVGASTWEAR